jgi:hypothetical protein
MTRSFFAALTLALSAAACAPHPVTRAMAADGPFIQPITDAAPADEPIIIGRSADAPAPDAPAPPPDAAIDAPVVIVVPDAAPPDAPRRRADAPPAPPPDAAPPRDTAPAEADGPKPIALYVSASTNLGGAAKVLSERLQLLGMTVTPITDGNANTASAAGKALIIVSATVASTKVTSKFRDVAVPVICMETNILGDMRMTGGGGGDHGTNPNVTQISVIDTTAHPLAAGLSGMVTVFTAGAQIEWGLPGPAAIRIATVTTDPTHAVIYGYDTGAMMVGGNPAPARRVGIFLDDSTGNGPLSPDGFKLLDAAVDWALSRR